MLEQPDGTTQNTRKISNKEPIEKQGTIHVLANDKSFLTLIRHTPWYSYRTSRLKMQCSLHGKDHLYPLVKNGCCWSIVGFAKVTSLWRHIRKRRCYVNFTI